MISFSKEKKITIHNKSRNSMNIQMTNKQHKCCLEEQLMCLVFKAVASELFFRCYIKQMMRILVWTDPWGSKQWVYDVKWLKYDKWFCAEDCVVQPRKKNIEGQLIDIKKNNAKTYLGLMLHLKICVVTVLKTKVYQREKNKEKMESPEKPEREREKKKSNRRE